MEGEDCEFLKVEDQGELRMVVGSRYNPSASEQASGPLLVSEPDEGVWCLSIVNVLCFS
jgi:hypothetical protein